MQALRSIFPDQRHMSRRGAYGVRLWLGDALRVVVVDDLVPCGADGEPLFARAAQLRAVPFAAALGAPASARVACGVAGDTAVASSDGADAASARIRAAAWLGAAARAMLVEKAAAKLFGSYSALADSVGAMGAGEALCLLTGGVARHFDRCPRPQLLRSTAWINGALTHPQPPAFIWLQLRT